MPSPVYLDIILFGAFHLKFMKVNPANFTTECHGFITLACCDTKAKIMTADKNSFSVVTGV